MASKPSILFGCARFGLFGCLASLWSQAPSGLPYSLSQAQLETSGWCFFWSHVPTGSPEFFSPSGVPPSPPPVLPYQRRCSSFSPPALLLLLSRWRSSSFSRPCSSSFSHRRRHRKGARGMVDHGQDDVFRVAPILLCDVVLLRLLLDLTWCRRRSGVQWCHRPSHPTEIHGLSDPRVLFGLLRL